MRFIALSLLLAGCATNTGVVPAGPDTFMISGTSATGFAAGGEVMADLYRQASAHCAGQGKEFLPISNNSRDGIGGRSYANASVTFRCLAKDDPELRRPNMQPVPDTVIEHRGS